MCVCVWVGMVGYMDGVCECVCNACKLLVSMANRVRIESQYTTESHKDGKEIIEV